MTKRSRFGCQTCKTRKVKCDETLPYCRRCTETGRQCDGPPKNKSIFVTSVPYRQQRVPIRQRSSPGSSSSAGSQIVSPPGQLTIVPDLEIAGKRALTFFIERAGPRLGGELDQEFWHGTVLQLSYQNPMVRNAVLAVSTLYEKPLSNPLSWPTSLNANFTQPEQKQAFKWYSQSLNGMSDVLQQAQTEEQLHLALTTCVLFACIEIQQLNVGNSMKLMKCGYSLLGQSLTRELVSRSPIIRHVLIPVFIRQTLVLLIHGYSLPGDWLPPDLLSANTAPTMISSLQDARTQLFLLMFEGFAVITASYGNNDAQQTTILNNARCHLENRLKSWHRSLEIYTTFIRQTHSLTPIQSRNVSLLKIYYLTSAIWLSTCLDPTECIYDMFTPQFEMILDLTESILSQGDLTSVTYTFELGIIPPLYFTGWRCRIPHLRRRALKLLERAPVQESLFHRDVDVFAIRRIIETEEGLPPDTNLDIVTGEIPPETARLRWVILRWDGPVQSRPHLVYSKWRLQEDENGQLQELQFDTMSL